MTAGWKAMNNAIPMIPQVRLQKNSKAKMVSPINTANGPKIIALL